MLNTKDSDNKFANAKPEEIKEIIEPSSKEIDSEADKYTYKNYIRGKFSYRLKLKLKSFFKF